MKEKDFQTVFRYRNTQLGVFELKIVQPGKPFRFDSVKPHQRKALLDVYSENGLFHKLTDVPVSAFAGMGKMRFTSQKPFDCFFLCNTPASVVVGFYIPRKAWHVVYIDIEQFLELEDRHPRKSIRHDELYRKGIGYSVEWPVGKEK